MSLRLDDALTEFETAALDRHLYACPACREFADDAGRVVGLLRAADLVEPQVRTFLPVRARPHTRRRRVAAVAAMGMSAAAAVVGISLGGGGSAPKASGSPVETASPVVLYDTLGVPRTHQVRRPAADGGFVRGEFGIPT